VANLSIQLEATSRSARMLRTALGPAMARFLDDPTVVEVMLDRDGRLWADRLASGLMDTGETVSASDGERIVRLVAHHVGAEVHAGAPRVSAELPETGERFEGLLPPVVAAPTFAIRKPAVAVFTLSDYVAAGIMSSHRAKRFAKRCRGPQEHPRRRRHVQRQDDADQRAPCGSCQDFGSGCPNRRHPRASMPSAESRGPAHQGRRRFLIGPCAFITPSAA
jgi:hypothetical protein